MICCGHYDLPTTNLLQPGHYNPPTYRLTTTWLLYTTWPLQSRHNPVTTNSLPRWSLWIATTWSLQPGHYKLATTILPQPRSLRIHYNPVATNSLQHFHYYNLATTQSLCYNQATTNLLTWSLQPSHYVDYKFLAQREPSWVHKACSPRSFTSLLSVNLKCICCSEYMRKQSKLACRCPSLQWVCYSHQCTIKQYAHSASFTVPKEPFLITGIKYWALETHNMLG